MADNMRFIYVVLLLLFCSCANNRLVKDVEKFMGRQITLSEDWRVVWKGKDTVLTGFMEVPVKLIVWYDSLGCASCEASKMYVWNDIVTEADSLSPFRIIYLFTPKKEDLLKISITLKADRLDYPVFIDQNATFVRQNPNLPKNKQLHSFLLDKDNKVVMVGSPLFNPALWRLYKNTIQTMIDNDGVLP